MPRLALAPAALQLLAAKPIEADHRIATRKLFALTVFEAEAACVEIVDLGNPARGVLDRSDSGAVLAGVASGLPELVDQRIPDPVRDTLEDLIGS